MKKPRPLSPHLTIYKPQITSVLSIAHRISGAYMFFGLIFLVWLVSAMILQNLGLAFFETNFMPVVDCILFKLFLFSLLVSLYYHLANGIRHLSWDAGFGFKIETVTKTGYAVIVFVLIATAVTLYIWYTQS
jgi:succinate dehydrogenase cytochrome b556 subunit/succinate dehydrogenase hydrophobic membrane anchor protein